jgi:DNA-binding response OmpR family regulator
MKILLLEDDFSLNRAIEQHLSSMGYFITSCYRGEDAIERLIHSRFDLCIFDIHLPDIDGHTVLEHLRNNKIETPVIIMSAMKDIETIKNSYTLGCDDYLKKPFDIEELTVRIDYLLNRSSSPKGVVLKHGFLFQTDSATLSKNGAEIELSSRERLALSLFVNNIGKTVSTSMMQEYVWDGEEVETVTIRSLIHKVKAKLKSGMIVNIRGVGYKLLE